MRLPLFFVIAKTIVCTNPPSDACADLCARDGPSVCTDGSWDRDGICSGYRLIGDNQYCYYTRGSGSACPARGHHLRVEDALRFLQSEQQQPFIESVQRVVRSTDLFSIQTENLVQVFWRLFLSLMRVSWSQFTGMFQASQQSPNMDWVNDVRKNLVQGFRIHDSSKNTALAVRRSHVLADALMFLNGPIDRLRNAYVSITFSGEWGSGVAVIREWLSQVAIQVTNPRSPFRLFHTESEGGYVSIRRDVEREDYEGLFRGIGRLLGFCFLNEFQLPVEFPKFFFTKLLGQRITVDMIKDENLALFNALSTIQKMEDRKDFRSVEVTIENEVHQVTLRNRDRLIEKILDSLVGPQDLFELVRSGFDDVIPIERIKESSLTAEHLKALIVGTPELDVDEMIDNAIFLGGDWAYRQSDAPILWLRKILKSFSAADQRQFLRFLTGSPRSPVGGFRTNPIQIDERGTRSDLPAAATRYNRLYLPYYRSEEIFREKLLTAIRGESQGMH
jgi:hypothetical protein